MTTLFSPSPQAAWYKRPLTDYAFAAALLAATLWALIAYPKMDGYDQGVFMGVTLGAVALAWAWRPLQLLGMTVAAATVLATGLYAGNIANAQSNFLLKYLFSSQSAILWMCTAFVMALVAYWFGLLFKKPRALWTGTALTWVGLAFGFTGLLVRWVESHLMGVDIGRIPVSNLYEVFVLFALITAGFYLYFEIGRAHV